MRFCLSNSGLLSMRPGARWRGGLHRIARWAGLGLAWAWFCLPAAWSADQAAPLRDWSDRVELPLPVAGATPLNMPYFVARRMDGAPQAQGLASVPTSALVILHGHPRDAGKSLAAAVQAARQAGRGDDSLLVAPLFPVARDEDAHCHSAGVPRAEAGDALWTCSSWMGGGHAMAGTDGAQASPAAGQGPGSFAALDQLLADVQQRWPSLRQITVAGFSAGGQFVQHYAGFARPRPGALPVRYVVGDPGSWLYFDALRPMPRQAGQPVDWSRCTEDQGAQACSFVWRQPDEAACPAYNRWKYGLQDLPADLSRQGGAQAARQRYAQADVAYLLGGGDTGQAPGTFYGILDKSCAAQLQGPYRLQRGLAYAAYDRAQLATGRPRHATVVAGCAHDVSCVFTAAAAARVLFPAAPP